MPVLLIVGLIVLVVGVITFFYWIGSILLIIKAVIPFILLIGGALITYLGWEEMKDRQAPNLDFSNSDEAQRYQNEAQAYQKEIIDVNQDETDAPGEAEEVFPKTEENKEDKPKDETA